MDNQDYKKSEMTIHPSGLMFNWEDTSNYKIQSLID